MFLNKVDFIKYRWPIILGTAFVGCIAGFFYWKFVGCVSGTCPITSKWHNTMAYGLVMGGLIGDLFVQQFKSAEEKEEQN